jgi:hypothetical protein
MLTQLIQPSKIVDSDRRMALKAEIPTATQEQMF